MGLCAESRPPCVAALTDPEGQTPLLSTCTHAGQGKTEDLGSSFPKASDRAERELALLLARFQANVGDAQQFHAALQSELAALEARLFTCCAVTH